MHTAFVLAAGLGTRLRPLTEVRPKPLVPVCGVPMLSYALALCARHGLVDVVVNAHWLGEQIVAWEGEREGVHVTVSYETPEVLGTGGGLRKVRDRLAPRFAVVNADVLCDVDLTALLAAVPPGGASMALRPDPADAPRYGVVAADATGTVVQLSSVVSTEPRGDVDRTTHFTGIHAMDRDALELVPDGFQDIVRTAYKALVPARKVAGVVHQGLWLDVGDVPAYLAANLAVLRGGLPLPLDPFARAERVQRGAGGFWIGPGADVGRDVVLRDAIVGAGAVVPDGTVLERTVVWDGVVVPRGVHRDVVLTR